MKRIPVAEHPGGLGRCKVNIMRPRHLLPMFILLVLVACVPYTNSGGYYPFDNYYGYQSPSAYYYYPYYSNPYGYYYYPHVRRHGGHKGFEHRGRSGHSGGRGAHGRGGRH